MGMLIHRHSTIINTATENKGAVEKAAPVVVEEKVEKVEPKKTNYTKTEINRMSTSDLQKLAVEYGLSSDLTGAEIKKSLINLLSL